MTLGDKRRLFSRLLGQLIVHLHYLGYECSVNEVWRHPLVAEMYAAQGKGIRDSVHCLGLAVDINLFKDKVYLTRSEDYKVLGDWWKEQNELCRWGGDFLRPDGCHFSLAHDGRS